MSGTKQCDRCGEFIEWGATYYEICEVTGSLSSITHDLCDAAPTVRLLSIESNEPERDDIRADIGTDDREFQLRAWKVLRSIPPAETRSYSWMAERLGIPGARRAVGRANGSNMLSIIIPCHRVIRADGSLCGYGGGLWRKKWLLEHEQRWKDART